MRSHLDASNSRLAEAQAGMRARHSPPPTTGERSAPPPSPAQPIKENLSIQDIAHKMGVSHDTALRIFRDHPEAFSINPDPANCKRQSLRVPSWAVDDFISARKRKNCRSSTDRETQARESA
jgi:hypothetical protein